MVITEGFFDGLCNATRPVLDNPPTNRAGMAPALICSLGVVSVFNTETRQAAPLMAWVLLLVSAYHTVWTHERYSKPEV